MNSASNTRGFHTASKQGGYDEKENPAHNQSVLNAFDFS